MPFRESNYNSSRLFPLHEIVKLHDSKNVNYRDIEDNFKCPKKKKKKKKKIKKERKKRKKRQKIRIGNKEFQS